MFFLIAGVQPKQTVLDPQARRCPACGLYQARLVRNDYYLSFFFLPLWRVKKGGTGLQCEHCGHCSLPEQPDASDISRPADGRACPVCGQTLEPSFRFCPYCGRVLKGGSVRQQPSR